MLKIRLHGRFSDPEVPARDAGIVLSIAGEITDTCMRYPVYRDELIAAIIATYGLDRTRQTISRISRLTPVIYLPRAVCILVESERS